MTDSESKSAKFELASFDPKHISCPGFEMRLRTTLQGWVRLIAVCLPKIGAIWSTPLRVSLGNSPIWRENGAQS